MARRVLRVTGLGSGLLAALACGVPDPAPRDPPNFVFILADDLGSRDTSYGGNEFYRTPHIDRLAREGMVFHAAYAAAPLCVPTRASILTGRHPARLHLTSNPLSPERSEKERRRAPPRLLEPPRSVDLLPASEITLAEELSRAGYRSGWIGKWHVGRIATSPESQGFEAAAVGVQPGPRHHFAPYGLAGLADGPEGEYLTDRLTDEAVRFLREHRDERFLLFLSHYAVHVPLEAKPELVERYRERMPAGYEEDDALRAAMVDSLDESVGRVMDELEALGLSDRTVVIFTSDGGGRRHRAGTAGSSLPPLRGGKGTLWEGGIRVPLIVRWPGGAVGESTVPVISTDFYPTLLELAGLEPEAGHAIDGESLVPLLTDRGPLRREAIYFHYPHYTNLAPPSAAVRRGDHKLIRSFEGPVALYDLSRDEGEERDIAGDRPALARELSADLEAWLARVGAELPTRRGGAGR